MAAKRRAVRGTAAGRRRPRGRAAQQSRVRRGMASAITGGEVITVGVLNLVRTTLTTALRGVKDVGAEMGSAGVAAVRGSIRAAAQIGEDLGLVSKGAVKGVITATDGIGGDIAGVARSVTLSAVKATGEVGGDVARTARKAVEGAIEAASEVGVTWRPWRGMPRRAPSKPQTGLAAPPAGPSATPWAARSPVCGT